MIPIFVGVNAHCRHGNSLSEESSDCLICEWENEVLGNTPPFKVECVDDSGCSLKKGQTYLVVGIVKDGTFPWGDKESPPGVLLEGPDKTLFPYLYRAGRFVLA